MFLRKTPPNQQPEVPVQAASAPPSSVPQITEAKLNLAPKPQFEVERFVQLLADIARRSATR